jgi:hypothetical protein
MEMVRQLFEEGILQSGFWHQFALTAHSPVGLNPDDYGVLPDYKAISFANNDIQFKDKTGIDHDRFSFGLKKSLFNFMHGIGLDFPLQDWFDFKVPRTTVAPDYIFNCLDMQEGQITKPSAKIVWLGNQPLVVETTRTKRGQKIPVLKMTFHDKVEDVTVTLEKEKGEWLLQVLDRLSNEETGFLPFEALKTDFENHFGNFDQFWYAKSMDILRGHGLLVL